MKNIILFFLLLCFNSYQAKALKNKSNTEEIYTLKDSSVLLFINDSVLKLNYDNIYKLYKNEKYYLSLEKALKFYDKCIKKENDYWAYKTLHLIGEINEQTNKFEESLNYYQKSLKKLNSQLLENSKSNFTDLDYAITLLKIGSLYQKLSNSIEEKNKNSYLDSAKFYYEKIERLPVLNINIENIKAKVFSNISGIYWQDSIFDKAENYAWRAIKIHEKNNKDLSKSISLNNLGNIYLSQQKYKESKEIYLEALNLIKNDNNPKSNRTKANLYFNLAWAMRNLKDYKAYDFQEMFYDIDVEIKEKEFSGIIEEITYKYDFDSKKALFDKEVENKRLRNQRNFWIAGILGFIIIISLVYIINLNKLKEKNLKLKLKQSKLIQNKNLNRLKSESQVRILNATIDGKESERKQIAETLHDSVSTLLSSANLHLQASRKQFNGSTPTEIDKTQEIILEASHKIRDLSHTLVSSVLLKFGLNFAIKDIAEKFSNSELKIETDIINIRRYHQNFEIKVYNITQEFINNILKHSKANNALIELREVNDTIHLIISDDGLGFDKTKINMKDGLGINQIDARIQMMKGKFHIESSKNNGTKISVELPVLEKEEPNHVQPVL